MVTYYIIEELETKGLIYKEDHINTNSVWLADDNTLIANTEENMRKNIKVLKEVSKTYGL